MNLFCPISLSFYSGFSTTLLVTFYLQSIFISDRLSPTLFPPYSTFSWPSSHVYSKLYHHFVPKCPKIISFGTLIRIVLYFDLVRSDAFIDFHETNVCINILKTSNVFLGSFMFAVYQSPRYTRCFIH